MPPLLRNGRTRLMALLVGTGLGHAAAAVLTVLAMPRLLGATATGARVGWLGALAGAAVAVGVLRGLERLTAERVGQHYVQEIRLGLVRSSLAAGGPSVGVTVARATNDLTAVRNWVAHGITPLTTAVPLIGGSLAALYLIGPGFALAVGLPALLLVVLLSVLAPVAYARSRELRKRRGRLAAHLADTVQAGPAIRAGGGVDREVRNAGAAGERVLQAAVARARVVGAIRGVAAGFAAISLVAVAAVGAWSASPGATVATALTVVGLLATPVADLGRVVEYRQSYRAAERILAPTLAAGGGGRRPSNPDGVRTTGNLASGLDVTDVVVDGRPVPDLTARPGARVLVRGRDGDRVRRALLAVAGAGGPEGGDVAWVRVAGRYLRDLSDRERRALVGYAARGQALERGTVARALRYRRPDSEEPVDSLVDAVGLRSTVEDLDRGVRSRLARGGEPLDLPDRARVLLARAVYGAPPLVVLDHLDAQLDARGRAQMRDVLAGQPGVVVVATDDPDVLGTEPTDVWDLDDG